MLLFFLFALITYTPTQFVYGSVVLSDEFRISYSGRALYALQRLLNFFESDANNLNLDGVYGIRIAQGQLNALHQVLKSSNDRESHVTDHNNIIYSLFTQAERIANLSLKQIAVESSSYLHRFSLIIYRPFKIDYQPRKINQNLIEQGIRNPYFDENISDQCFGELLGKFI